MDNWVPACFVRSLLTGYRSQRDDIHALLSRCGISRDILDLSYAHIPSNELSILVDAICESLGDEFLGMTQSPSKLGTFGMMCRSIIHSEHLLQSLNRSVRFYNLCNDDIRFSIKEHDGALRFSIDMDPSKIRGDQAIIFESIYLLWFRLSSWLIGRPLELRVVAMPYEEPDHSGYYPSMFACPVYFSQKKSFMEFELRDGQAPVVKAEGDLKRLLGEAPVPFLYESRWENCVSKSLKQVLKAFPNWDSQPSMEEAAQVLQLSPQTLHRRLKDEGLTFMEVKNQVRSEMAMNFLAAEGRSINQIAQMMGFSEPSTFHRAFKKWTGKTPGAYRRDLN